MKKILVVLSLAVLGLASCTDASRSQIGGYGDKHLVELYSGGKLVRTWTSTGKVQSTENSDGYYFRDEKCGCNVEVSGDIVITRMTK